MPNPTRIVRIKRQTRAVVRITEVSLSWDDSQEDIPDYEAEPSAVIGRKAEMVAELLGCSYEEAEHVVLGFSQQ